MRIAFVDLPIAGTGVMLTRWSVNDLTQSGTAFLRSLRDASSLEDAIIHGGGDSESADAGEQAILTAVHAATTSGEVLTDEQEVALAGYAVRRAASLLSTGHREVRRSTCFVHMANVCGLITDKYWCFFEGISVVALGVGKPKAVAVHRSSASTGRGQQYIRGTLLAPLRSLKFEQYWCVLLVHTSTAFCCCWCVLTVRPLSTSAFANPFGERFEATSARSWDGRRLETEGDFDVDDVGRPSCCAASSLRLTIF